MEPTLYSVIGLTPEASEKSIYRSVKKMARHVKDSEAPRSEKKNLIKYIKLARDTLMDPKSREEYDRTIGIETIGNSSNHNNDIVEIHSNPLDDLLGSILSTDHMSGSMVPFGSSMVPHGGSSRMDPLGSLMSNHMDMLQSVIPQGFGDMGSNMKSGTFHFMEYTKVRNPTGGFDEFGVTREGDTSQDRVTEKRFHKKG